MPIDNILNMFFSFIGGIYAATFTGAILILSAIFSVIVRRFADI